VVCVTARESKGQAPDHRLVDGALLIRQRLAALAACAALDPQGSSARRAEAMARHEDA